MSPGTVTGTSPERVVEERFFPKFISAKLESSKQDSMWMRPHRNHRNKVAWDRAQPGAGQEGTGARARFGDSKMGPGGDTTGVSGGRGVGCVAGDRQGLCCPLQGSSRA